MSYVMTTYDGSYVIERLIANANGDCTGAEARGLAQAE